MLKRTPLGLSIALLFTCPIPDAAAGMHKCTDGRQITYTSEPCEKTGLTSAGPIKDAVTVMPLIPKTQSDPPGKSGKDDGERNDVSRDSARDNNDADADVSGETTTRPANKMLK